MLFSGGGLGVEGRELLGGAVNKDGIKIWVRFVIGVCFVFSAGFRGLGFGGEFGGGRGVEGVDHGAGLGFGGEDEGGGEESAAGVVVGTGCVVGFGDGVAGPGTVGPGGVDLRLCAVVIHIYPTGV